MSPLTLLQAHLWTDVRRQESNHAVSPDWVVTFLPLHLSLDLRSLEAGRRGKERGRA